MERRSSTAARRLPLMILLGAAGLFLLRQVIAALAVQLTAAGLVALAALNTDPGVLIARAFENLAQNAGKIGSLNISPELLECLKVRNEK